MRAHPIGLELAEQADTPKIVGSPNEAARPFVLGFHGEVDEAGGGPRVASIELIGRELMVEPVSPDGA